MIPKETVYTPGKHLLLDFYGAHHLSSVQHIERALTDAAKACCATILDMKLHSFGENSGVTGMVLLAESHISIHTWPETGFVALDVFVCGDCNARLAIAPLVAAFRPQKVNMKEVKRGVHG
ncbi:MAG: adenosylmethionine decarboxylase [Ghiorsea sp.]|nr:adenosylmethionine decarboxylase [Ghiorsea sp.]